MATRSQDTAAIARATGRSWAEIADAFAAAGGESLSHRELADIAAGLFTGIDNPDWWAQGAAVAYEQQIGRRLPGQRADGTFEVSITKTVPGDPDDALGAFEALMAGRSELGGIPFAEAPVTSRTQKWRYWRVPLSDGTRIAVTIGTRRPGASGVAVQVSRLTGPEAVETWRERVRSLLAGM